MSSLMTRFRTYDPTSEEHRKAALADDVLCVWFSSRHLTETDDDDGSHKWFASHKDMLRGAMSRMEAQVNKRGLLGTVVDFGRADLVEQV